MVAQFQKIHLKRPEKEVFRSVLHSAGLQGVNLHQMPEAVKVPVMGSLDFATRKGENEKLGN